MMARRQCERGVSLMEALVALAVMSFGLLGVVGMQATLRSNSDVTKQRAEAVRIAQAAVEDRRAFEQLNSSGTIPNFADLADAAAVSVAGTNATFARSAVITPAATLPASAPRLKTVTMRVAWEDRSGQTNEVSLVSSIAGIAPELAGSLSLPGDRAVTQRPRGRHAGIPDGATPPPPNCVGSECDRSTFTVPGGGGMTWVFNNISGIITSVCQTPLTCLPSDLQLLSGYINFATTDMPSLAEGELPTDAPPSPSISAEVVMTLPSASTVSCYTQIAPSYIAYYCALPITTLTRNWSGRSRITGLPISSTLADATPSKFKVCRYTPTATDTPPGGNARHPLDYTNVNGPLTNQNFLVISAGDASVGAFGCPGEGPSPFIDSHTYRHQPLS